MGIGRAAEGFSIFDVFAPTQENPRTRTSSRTSTIEGLRTIERKEKRAIEHQIFLEISSSYLVFVLQSYSSSSSTSAVAGQGENLDEASYNKLALMGFQPWEPYLPCEEP